MDEDIDSLYGLDGLQNVQPPEGWVEAEQARIESLVGIELNDTGDGLPQRSDKVAVWLTPEQLVILKQSLEAFACGGFCQLDYTRNTDIDLYQQQGIIREMRDEIDGRIDYYVTERPYTPFLPKWVKKIGKENVRKLQAVRS